MIVSHVYVVGVERNPVKIGIAANVERRLTSLQIGCPDTLTVYWRAMLPNKSAYNVEKAVHRELSRHHRRGEWFNVDVDTAVETIKRLAPDVVERDGERVASRIGLGSGDALDELIAKSKVQPDASETVHWYRVLLQNNLRVARKVDAMVAKEAGVTALAALRTFVLERKAIREVMGNHPPAIRRAQAAVIAGLKALRGAHVALSHEAARGELGKLIAWPLTPAARAELAL